MPRAAVRSEPTPERLALPAAAPALTTAAFYALPDSLQQSVFVQMLPQMIAYVGLGVWAATNDRPLSRLGLRWSQLGEGLAWGALVGMVLGLVNAWVILRAVPALGADIAFLRDTPHARVPVIVMVPWVILAIALMVELNFRGFQLGRLEALARRPRGGAPAWVASAGAVVVSALVFAFDPFMVSTFRHLHWIALWDGLIWGCLWLRRRNLWATITAHAIEVVILYTVVRSVLSGGSVAP